MLPTFALGLLIAAVQPGEVRVRSGPYTPVSKDAIRAESLLVEMMAIVRNHSGKPVGGLGVRDFSLLDNGKPQTIAVLTERVIGSREGALALPPPKRTIALYFDDTHASIASLIPARKAARSLIETGLLPGDVAGIFTDSGSVTLAYTSDKAALLDAVERIRPHPKPQPTLGVCPEMNSYQAYAAANDIDIDVVGALVAQAKACNCAGGEPSCEARQPQFVKSMGSTYWTQFRSQSRDSLSSLASVVKGLAPLHGVKMLALLSPGFVSGGLDGELNAIVNEAVRGQIVIGAVRSNGLVTAWPKAGMMLSVLAEAMRSTAAATGGRFIDNTNDIAGALQMAVTPPEVMYELGFYPSSKPDGKSHQLKLRVNKPGYEVISRTSYYAEVPPEPAETAQVRIDQAIVSSEEIGGVEAKIRIIPVTAGKEVRIEVLVDASQLSFLERDGRNAQQLTFTVVLVDAAGKMLVGKQGIIDLELLPATLKRFRETGIAGGLTFPRPAGQFRARVVVREAMNNRIGAWTVSP